MSLQVRSYLHERLPSAKLWWYEGANRSGATAEVEASSPGAGWMFVVKKQISEIKSVKNELRKMQTG